MGKHSISPSAAVESTVAELAPSFVAPATDIYPRKPDKNTEDMPVMHTSASFNLGRSIVHSAVAAVASFAGVTAISAAFDGSSSAHSVAAFHTSSDSDFDEDANKIPAALTGSDTAQMRSVANDIANEAQTTPMCNTGGATGIRAAYVNTENLLVWPLMPGTYTLTSPFGGRVHPISHTVKMHNGQDLAGRVGTPVYAAADGIVDKVGGDSNNTVRIRHEINGEVFYTAYLHMYSGDILVHVGQKVSAGERIGAIGSAGYSTGAHLHFETHNSSGTPVEPTNFMRNHGAIQMTQMCR